MANTYGEYRPILDNRRLDDELAEARRILSNFALKWESGNENPVRSRHIDALDVDVIDVRAFFERWPDNIPIPTFPTWTANQT